jgi:hypothetical protein
MLNPGSEEWLHLQRKTRDCAELMRTEFGLTEVQFKNALLLLGGMQIGCSAKRIARFTGLAEGFVRRRKQKLLDEGIWSDDGKTHCSWFEESGEIAFICDVLVLDGKLTRVQSKTRKHSKKPVSMETEPQNPEPEGSTESKTQIWGNGRVIVF